jgi:hypothetical protein
MYRRHSRNSKKVILQHFSRQILLHCFLLMSICGPVDLRGALLRPYASGFHPSPLEFMCWNFLNLSHGCLKKVFRQPLFLQMAIKWFVDWNVMGLWLCSLCHQAWQPHLHMCTWWQLSLKTDGSSSICCSTSWFHACLNVEMYALKPMRCACLLRCVIRKFLPPISFFLLTLDFVNNDALVTWPVTVLDTVWELLFVVESVLIFFSSGSLAWFAHRCTIWTS